MHDDRPQRRTIAIAGGGIGGLTAALALAQRGFRCIVLERNAVPATQGAGIQISPNALKVLDALGAGRRVRQTASTPDAIRVRDGRTGEELSRYALGAAFRARYGAPYLVIHRADLLHCLMTECHAHESISIRHGCEVLDVADHRRGVTVLIQDGDGVNELSAAALIGADGAWSHMRGSVEGAAIPEATGLIAWRALIPSDALPGGTERDDTVLWLAPHSHVVHYPVRQGGFLNIVCVMRARKGEETARGWLKQKGPLPFDIDNRWHDDIRSLFSEDVNWGGWPLMAVAKVGRISQNHVALVGDAAHAMLPFAAQGGACAIEDAAVLAHCCAAHADDLETALARYDDLRRSRAERIVALARSNGRIYHMAPPLSLFRNAVMRRMGEASLSRRVDWIYGWEAPK